jgi:hypothetical protein
MRLKPDGGGDPMQKYDRPRFGKQRFGRGRRRTPPETTTCFVLRPSFPHFFFTTLPSRGVPTPGTELQIFVQNQNFKNQPIEGDPAAAAAEFFPSPLDEDPSNQSGRQKEVIKYSHIPGTS